ncbi:Transcription factor MADS-box [Arabidopsis suecica]|uniref:Transcription factor MADS-box n=1 Tax=Arabidopsis suecica TaxID=45249 RepID=A0A8T1Y391_ARASU|nr:Transcription factor MADS-box [Arabidopsis suecica]
MGRRKVEIKRIENKSSRQVTFSKKKKKRLLSPNDAKVSSRKLDNFQFSGNLPSLFSSSPAPAPENSTTLLPVTNRKKKKKKRETKKKKRIKRSKNIVGLR